MIFLFLNLGGSCKGTGEEAGYEMREVIMGIPGETSCSGTWLAFSLIQALILQSLSFYSARSSALGTEDVIGNRSHPFPRGIHNPAGENDK